MSQSSVLVVEDEAILRDALSDTLDLAGYPVASARSGREALDIISRQDISMVISDVQMKPMDGHLLLEQIRQHRPEIPVLLMTAYGSIQNAVAAIQHGAVDYLVKPFEAEVLVNMVARYIRNEPADTEMVAVDEKTRSIAVLASRVAGTDVTVMISGESGTGKEVLARYLHDHSPRAAAPFVAINCAAIPENMLEATLFGYEKGAFTGAYHACPGKFEQAQGGTLLLDEISEMDLGLQAKILRVLQEREVERLGGRKMIDLDVRVLATSNRRMTDEVSAGRFREDLFYRLNVFPLHLPPLRERCADILPLANRLCAHSAGRSGRPAPLFSQEAQGRLLAHSWPGNVRELDNVVQRALIFQMGEMIEVRDIQFEVSMPHDGQVAHAQAEARESLNSDLRTHEQTLILETLQAEHGSRKRAAEKLGISQRTLRYKLAQMRVAGIAIPER